MNSFSHELRKRIAGLSDQLYIQAQCLIEVVADVIQNSVLYYSNYPKTMGNFSWRIDSKDKRITEYEDLWKTIVCPFLQSIFLQKPLITIKEGNYRYLKKYENPPNFPHEHLNPYRKKKEGDFLSVDLKKIMIEDLSFLDSSTSIGVQIVDILVNIVRRACRGTLKKEGWKDIGKLMLHPFRGKNTIRFISFGISEEKRGVTYKDVFFLTDRAAKRLC